MRIIRRALFAAACLAAGALEAQVYTDSATLLRQWDIRSLPEAEKAAWYRYMDESWRRMELNWATPADEVRALGGGTITYTYPQAGPNFELEEGFAPPGWLATDSARRIADAVVSWQTPSGGWAKRVDLTRGPRRPAQLYSAERYAEGMASFDRRATISHLRFLANVHAARPDTAYRDAFVRGMDYIFAAQYPNGCWPQVFPIQGGGADAVHFDNLILSNILFLLHDVARGEVAPFVDEKERRRAGESLARGVRCLVDTQVVVDGRRTGWSARHDPLTLRPIPAPGGDPVALRPWESAVLLDFLMRQEADDPDVAAAVRGGVAWLRETMLWGWALPPGQKPAATPGAGPVWVRLVETGSNRGLYVWNRILRSDWRDWADSTWGYTWFTEQPRAALDAYEPWAAARASLPLPPVPERPDVLVDAGHTGPDGRVVGGLPIYRTIGAALVAAPADGRQAFVIAIRNGRYREKLSVQKPNIHLIGESRDGTVLTYDVAAGHISPGGWQYGTRGSWTLHVAAPGFRLERMTVENGFDFMANAAKSDSDPTRLRGTQAVAVMLDEGSDRAVFRDCRLSGHQDTLFPNSGRAYFNRCEILGSVDFIFGAGRAVFDDCDIVSRDRGSADSNGYITAPSTRITQPYGFLFIGGRLRKETPSMAPNSVTLGRPWHPSGRPDAIGSTVFIGTWMDDHIGATGWSPMNSTDAAGHRVENQPEDARFFEHGSTGPGAVASPRRRVLTPEQAAEYTVVRVLDGWDPRQ
jgi:pectinesterase